MEHMMTIELSTLSEILGADTVPTLLEEDWELLWGEELEAEEELSF